MTTNKNKSGYKKTKVGWIPKEWEVETIGDLFYYLKTYSFSRADLNYENGTILNIHYGDLHTKFSKNFHVDIDENTIQLPYITNENTLSEDSFLRTGDLILADASEDYEGVGQCVEVNILGDSKVTAGLHTFALRDSNNQTSERYRSYIFQNEKVKKQIKRIATGISVLGISKKNLSSLSIPLPPMREQKKIAEILSTWDEAIESTEKLIAAQVQRKKWLMQQLLTGKTRFSGFTAKWKRVKLGDVFNFHKGKGLSKKDIIESGVHECILYGELYTKYNEIVKFIESRTNQKEGENSRSGDLLIPSSTTTSAIDLANVTALLKSNIQLGGDIIIMRAKVIEKVNSIFIAFLLTNIEKNQIAKISQGITIIHVYSSQLKNISISLPPLTEQEKIAEVLCTQDELIEGLRDEKQRLVEQKRGLMQVLLTGKVRV